jgi:hypothetical protein
VIAQGRKPQKNKQTPTYVSYRNMLARCHNPKNKRFKDYGGRGITVCARWRQSWPNFVADMGEKPGRDYQIDRIDNSQGYSPSNCRWATRSEQQRNMRSNHLLTAFGQTLCLSEWAERLGIRRGTLHTRLRRGWASEAALAPPNWQWKRQDKTCRLCECPSFSRNLCGKHYRLEVAERKQRSA